MIRLAGCLILAVTASCVARGPAPGGEATGARADRVVAGLRPGVVVVGAAPVLYRLVDRLAHHHVPGVSIAVVDSGRIVWARGFGVREAGTTDSVTPTTFFQAASISKPVTATAMLRLVDQGVLDLDTPVNHYLTSWKLPDNRFTAEAPVTLRRIVSHNAGLTVHGFRGYATGDAIPTVPQILDGLKPANSPPVRVDTTPGSIWRYSGGGTTVMQLVLTDITGETFPALMKRLVLDPAGMTESGYHQPLPVEMRGHAATGHEGDGSVTPGRWFTYPEMGPAGLWTTPSDLVKWAMAIAAARNGGGHAILSQRLATEMLTEQKAPSGLGPMLHGSGRMFWFGHDGANHGFRSDLVYFPELGRGAAVMANGDQGTALIEEVMRALAAEYSWPGYRPAREVELVAADSTELTRYPGSYVVSDPAPATLTISSDGRHLFAEVSGYMVRAEIGLVAVDRGVNLDTGDELTFVFQRVGPATRVDFWGVSFSRVDPR